MARLKITQLRSGIGSKDNQRQTLRNRRELVSLLYTDPAPPGVITAAR